jgi:hypothetical protein
MPQIAREEFERLPLRVHAFLAGVPLHDVWAVDLPRKRGGITLAEFLRRAGDLFRRPPPAVQALLSVRFFVGGLFGWDQAAPGSVSESFAQRLTDEDRARSLVPAGTPDGLFRVVYRFENEQLDEIINRTAHAERLAHSSRLPRATASTSPSTCARSAASPRSTWPRLIRSAK